jgi:glycopeptide antibiotics resistance protein
VPLIDPGLPPSYGGHPPIVPGIAIALLLALVLSGWVARRLGSRRLTAWLLLATLGVILAVTLTPSRWALEYGVAGSVTCDLSRIGPASLAVYLRFNDPTLNILLFIPLGVLIGGLDRRQHRRPLMVGAALLPFAIESLQAVVVPIGRACQGGDVFDNLAGLVVGLAIGAAWRHARAGR